MSSSDAREPLLVIVGPTATGKTDLAIALAERENGEIVSADSVQVYRGFDIGSGKPTEAERARAPHHLIDILDPDQAIDAASWAARAEEAVSTIRANNKLPIVCGGTFLWVRALLFGLAQAPPADEALRGKHREFVDQHGRVALHARLADVDAKSAARLSPNDFVRVSRALEVYELSGTPMSEWQARHGFRQPRVDARLLGVQWERADHDARIAARVRAMLDAGWIDEVRTLRAMGHGQARAMGSVGYRAIAEALDRGGAIDESELATGIVRATRVFARRQRTWLRDQPVRWLSTQVLETGPPTLDDLLAPVD